MSLDEVLDVCKELDLVCKPQTCGTTDWYIYTSNSSIWISCYYLLFAHAIIFNSGEPLINNKDEFREGLKRKLKKLKEEAIMKRIKSLEKDFENETC